MFLTSIMLLFYSVQSNICVVLSLARSVRVLVSNCPLYLDYYIIQRQRKQFYIGQAESLDPFECTKNVATYIDTQATSIVQSIINMSGMLMLGDLGACPLQENVEKQVLF